MRRGLGAVVVAAAMSTLVVAPAGADIAPTPDPTSSVTAAVTATSSSCNRMRVRSCLLPYPSDQYERYDPTSATGYDVDIPSDLVPPEILSQLGPGATITDAYGDADGYSVVSPVIFETPNPIDPSSLPADGGEAFKVFDVLTGERVPIRAEVSRDAERLGAANSVIIAWPRTRFRYGGRYIAAITDELEGPWGAPVGRAAELGPRGRRAGSRADQVWLDRLLRWSSMVDPGGWDHYLSVTSFVVRSEANATADLDRMAAIVRSEDHPIRNIALSPSTIGGAFLVTGQVRTTDFRDADGVIGHGEGITRSDHWVDFMMVMPDHPAGPNGAPVVIYGHGIAAFKESMLATASANAALGLATVGIDIPNHGSRSQFEGGWLLDLAWPAFLGRLTSMPLQGELDNLSLFMAIRQHFGEIDTFPWRWWNGTWGDGVKDLDPSHVLYQGTSMGGFLGASLVAMAPELDGAFLQVAGSGIIDTLFHSVLWPFFTSVEPAGGTGGDTAALVAAAGMLLERSDNTYLLDRIRAARTPLWLVYAANDGTVPNASSERLISLLDLPVVGPRYAPLGVRGIRVTDTYPADGIGASQIPTDHVTSGLLAGLLTHTTFVDPGPTAELNRWTTERIAAMGLNG